MRRRIGIQIAWFFFPLFIFCKAVASADKDPIPSITLPNRLHREREREKEGERKREKERYEVAGFPKTPETTTPGGSVSCRRGFQC